LKHQQAIRWTPREITYPDLIWQTKAESILFDAYKYLLSAAGRPHRAWLNARGINNNTIKAARFGWNTTSIHFDRESWGLDSDLDKSGKPKSVWVPAGLIIPQFKSGRPVRLRVRQENPVSSDRYIVVPGSAMGFFDYDEHVKASVLADMTRPAIITEAEIDGWLLHQELSDSLRVYSIGNASARPDISAHEYIKTHPTLLNLDNDTAGIQEIPWWTKQYRKSIPWFCEFGKDPGESFEINPDIRAWGLAGIEVLRQDFPLDLAAIDETVATIAAESVINHQQRVLEEYDARRKETAKIELGPEPDFLLDPEPALPPETQQVKPVIAQVCAHNLYCQTLKDGRCLITGTDPLIDLDRCPGSPEQWYKYRDSELLTTIIFSPGFSKNGQNRKHQKQY
jgi:hypothetical protein